MASKRCKIEQGLGQNAVLRRGWPVLGRTKLFAVLPYLFGSSRASRNAKARGAHLPHTSGVELTPPPREPTGTRHRLPRGWVSNASRDKRRRTPRRTKSFTVEFGLRQRWALLHVLRSTLSVHADQDCDRSQQRIRGAAYDMCIMDLIHVDTPVSGKGYSLATNQPSRKTRRLPSAQLIQKSSSRYASSPCGWAIFSAIRGYIGVLRSDSTFPVNMKIGFSNRAHVAVHPLSGLPSTYY
ncbi:hypothetical protein AWB74_06213 [Caballeronia arvi]|uniref:Uncharacterized protein n=1 Tax=Caballeronia arvi TaxID=1777135 RepID=A0A158KMB6_9BURK|nr:hypothetical protein AWB74_06213 [Caballeronia arvi]